VAYNVTMRWGGWEFASGHCPLTDVGIVRQVAVPASHSSVDSRGGQRVNSCDLNGQTGRSKLKPRT
jgi:hypothetical protein